MTSHVRLALWTLKIYFAIRLRFFFHSHFSSMVYVIVQQPFDKSLMTWLLISVRECVSTNAVGAQTRTSFGYHLLHPRTLRLLVLSKPTDFETLSSPIEQTLPGRRSKFLMHALSVIIKSFRILGLHTYPDGCAKQVLFGAWTIYTYIFGQSELAKKYNGSTGKVKWWNCTFTNCSVQSASF